MVFSMTGKMQFERIHMDVFSNVQFPVVDRFLQVANNNTFVYMGPVLNKELKEWKRRPKKKKDDDEE